MSALQTDDGFEPARRAILAKMLELADFDGWTPIGLRKAAHEAGFDRSTLLTAFPGGIRDILTFWSESLDKELRDAVEAAQDTPMKVREKVSFAIEARLCAMADHREAARRAGATLAMPAFAGLGQRLIWRTSNEIWRAIGDGSTDFNYYTKRMTLAAVWTSVITHWFGEDGLDDDSDEITADGIDVPNSRLSMRTRNFIDARIENVMQIEKAKASVRKLDLQPEKLISTLAKFRYGTGAR